MVQKTRYLCRVFRDEFVTRQTREESLLFQRVQKQDGWMDGLID